MYENNVSALPESNEFTHAQTLGTRVMSRSGDESRREHNMHVRGGLKPPPKSSVFGILRRVNDACVTGIT